MGEHSDQPQCKRLKEIVQFAEISDPDRALDRGIRDHRDDGHDGPESAKRGKMKLQPQTVTMTFLLALMTAIGPITMDIYLASLPFIGQALGAQTAHVQLTMTFYLVGFAVGQIFYGPLSDSIGRRPMLLSGFFLYLAATLTCAVANSIDLLIVARLFQGLGAAGPIIIARAIVRDFYSGSAAARQLGLMSVIMGVAPIGAPILGGFLQAGFGWRASFIAMAMIGASLTTIALFLLPETNARRGQVGFSPKAIAKSFAIIASDKAYRAYLTMLALTYCGVFAFLSSSSHVLQDVFHMSSVEFGFTFAVCSFGYIVGNAIGTRLVKKMRLEGMLRLGAGLALSASFLQILGHVAFPTAYLAIVIPDALYFMGCAFMVPQIMAAALTPFGERAGAASSLMGFSQMTSAAVVGSILGAMLGGTAWPMITVMALSAVAVGIILLLTTKVRLAARREYAER